MPKNKQQEAQEKRLQKNIRQAKKTRADAKQGKTKSARSKPSKKGGFFAGLKADAPQTVQQSIPYREMYRDGICRLTDTLYTKTVQFFDINYPTALNLWARQGFARHITGIKLPPTERQRNYSKNQQRPTQDLLTGRLLATTRS